jgi:hypothetical protein
MPRLVNAAYEYERQPYRWLACAACGAGFPTQDRRQRYCCPACSWRTRCRAYRRRKRVSEEAPR